MTVTIPPDLERTLKDRADRMQLPVDAVIRQALAWFAAIDPDLAEEFAAIEEAHSEALWLVEDSAP
jgi:predicted transcriptional regulator